MLGGYVVLSWSVPRPRSGPHSWRGAGRPLPHGKAVFRGSRLHAARGHNRGPVYRRTAGGGQAGHCRTARPFSRIQVARRAWPQPWSRLPCGGTILACRLIPGRSPQMPIHSGVTHLGITRSVPGIVVHVGHKLQNLHYWFCKYAISRSTLLVWVW